MAPFAKAVDCSSINNSAAAGQMAEIAKSQRTEDCLGGTNLPAFTTNPTSSSYVVEVIIHP